MARGLSSQFTIVGKAIAVRISSFQPAIIAKVVLHVVASERGQFTARGVEVADQASVGIPSLIWQLV